MLQALAFGLGVGAAIQAWRNFPPDTTVNADTLAWLFVIGLAVAWLSGRWSSHGKASAWASAHAEASATSASTSAVHVQLLNVVPGQGARPDSLRVPSETVAWLDGDRPAITQDDLEGCDLSELGIEHEPEASP